MSTSDLAVVVADAIRLRAIRYASPFSCRVLYFTDSNLVSAFESIRAHEPRVVALESHFAHTAEGRVFADRLQKLAMSGSEVHLISFSHGEWSTRLPGAKPAMRAAPGVGVNTRRVPRFPVINQLAIQANG